MRIHVMSDLHFDHQPDGFMRDFGKRLSQKVQEDRPDLCILAGDIGSVEFGIAGPRLDLPSFAEIYPQVIYLPGNHEFFGGSIETVQEMLRDECANVENIHLLEPAAPIYLDKKIITGGTMWYPEPPEWLKSRWVDYVHIEDAHHKIAEEHKAFKEHRFGEIVVSHMMPTSESIHPRFAGQPTNCFFNAGLDTYFKLKGAGRVKLWVHGHTHYPFDYKSKYGFRVYCNPMAYPNEGTNPDFWNRLLIEV